ncbi:MAG: arsenite methyltransferase [Ktedonobacteraceae bacterium]|nr:arsenite methyltransferase [Ktedonobacteraceae bacterium]
MSTTPQNDEQVRAAVRERYTRAAQSVLQGRQSAGADCCTSATTATAAESCCGSDCCSTENEDPITANIYQSEELAGLPIAAALASRGCGNPTALAELKAGERVLDLGSGGGIDVLLSARRVGPTGFAYGLDMTDAMLEIAERNRAEAGISNVQFLKGLIEDIPLPAGSVDVVISNCVINLAADKSKVLREAYRVLAPGGRLAVSDIVFLGHMPQAIRSDLEAWAGCISGALEESVYRDLLAQAGFSDIDIEVTRRYSVQDVAESGGTGAIAALTEAEQREIEGKFASAFIRARKP